MKRILLSSAIAGIVFALIVGAVEYHWRALGYLPGLIDSQDLWAQQRQRVDHPGDKTALALLGASRTVYSVDLTRVRARLPDYEPVMLALDATPAMATLRDLAQDGGFTGVALVDIDGLGLWKPTWDLQQPYVDHYHRQWTPSLDMHRHLLSRWQQHAVIARPDFGLLRSLVRYWNGEGEPFRPYAHINAAREGFIDFSKTDASVHRRELEAHLARNNGRLPAPAPAEWLAALTQAKPWVQAIQARGGKVIFYATPISGLRRKVEEDSYPRALYWNHIAQATGASTLHADDVPALRDFPLPDESHIDYRDKARYTDLLIDALVDRQLL